MSIPRNDMRQALHEYGPHGKQEVTYRPTDADFIKVGHRAFIKPLNHPDTMRVSNIMYALTSTVISYEVDSGIFETLNTIYIPEK